MKRVTDFFTPVAKKQHKPATNSATPSSKSMNIPLNEWIESLNPENKELLKLEIDTLDPSYFEYLRDQLVQPYFLNLKRFLKSRETSKQTVFPPPQDIYSWSRLTPLKNVKVLILGQDPYHNVGQAHGLAFSVNPPTPPPPSLVNIYKELKNCYPQDFEIPKHGSLVNWAKQGVLMLNACLTVDAHKANSHANKGWETFTEEAIKTVLKYNEHVVILAWGNPAAKRVEKVKPGKQHLVLRSVHPSPLSASRGWFGTAHFVKANAFLKEHDIEPIDWSLVPKPRDPESKESETKEPETKEKTMEEPKEGYKKEPQEEPKEEPKGSELK